MTSGRGTRAQIIDIAEHLLLKKGFNGFSYKHISTQLGIKNAAIHYHFPSKEDLGAAIIQHTRKAFQAGTQELETQQLNPWQKLDWFFSIYLNNLQKGEVCLGGTLGTDFNAIPGKMQSEVQALISEILTWLEKLLQDGRNQGDFSFSGNAAEKAVVVLASVQGALQIARVTSSKQFYAAVSQLKQDLAI
jgi:TetR/AcrR family transcriptional repressor of nem operon